MLRLVAIDTGPLGLLTHPGKSEQRDKCVQWLATLSKRGVRVILPEINDYELRREYWLNDSQNALSRLDALASRIQYLPLSTEAMQRSARMWAQAWKGGFPTADRHALDGDCIMASQVLLEAEHSNLSREEIIIATTNVGHLTRFAPADLWHNITPPLSTAP